MGGNCLRRCCLPGAKLPLYAFKKMDKILWDKDFVGVDCKEPVIDFLNSLLLGEWEDRMQRGLFRYDVIRIYDILDYPVRGLIFEGGNTLNDLSNVVSDSCICLQENNIPYNVLIADSGKRIFLFPQCYMEKQALGEVSSELLDTQVNPAVWEISGHMVLKRKEDFEGASEENAWRLLAEVSLSEERLQEVKELIFEAICCRLEKDDDGTPQNTFNDSTGAAPSSSQDLDSLKGAHPTMVPV